MSFFVRYAEYSDLHNISVSKNTDIMEKFFLKGKLAM